MRSLPRIAVAIVISAAPACVSGAAERTGLVGVRDDFLVKIDRDTGAVVESVATPPTLSPGALTYDSLRDRVLAVDRVFDELIELDLQTGMRTVIGPIGFNEVLGLTHNPIADVFYGIDSESRSLLRIDPNTGQGQAVLDVGFTGGWSLAFDTSSGLLYTVRVGTAELFRIDLSAESITLIGEVALDGVPWVSDVGLPSISGMVFERRTGTLLASSGFMGSQPSPAAGHFLGPFGTGPLSGVAIITKTGDFNGDGAVDVGDFLAWRSAYGTTVPAGRGADGNFDGRIDAADYTIWRDNYVEPAATAGAPEPHTLSLAALAGALLRWRRFGCAA